MGVQNDGKNTHRRDTIPANVQKWGSHPSRGRTFKLQGTQPRRRQEWRDHTPSARSGKWSQGDSKTKACTVPRPHGKALQLPGPTQRLQGWRPRPKEIYGRYKRPHTREAQPQLGKTLPNHIMAEEGHLPPGDDRRTEAATSMEHRVLAKVLPVKRMTRRSNTLLFLV